MLKENEFTNNVNQFNFQTVNDALFGRNGNTIQYVPSLF